VKLIKIVYLQSIAHLEKEKVIRNRKGIYPLPLAKANGVNEKVGKPSAQNVFRGKNLFSDGMTLAFGKVVL